MTRTVVIAAAIIFARAGGPSVGDDETPHPAEQGYEEGISTPPQDLHAEQATLGAMLVEPSAIDRVLLTGLKPRDFYRDAHKRMCQAILVEYEARKPVDLITVTARLKAMGALEDVGGPAYLLAVIRETPTAAHVVRYAQIVVDKAQLRDAIGLSADVNAAAYRADATGVGVLAAAQEQLDRLVSERRSYRRGEGIRELADRSGMDLLEEIGNPQAIQGARFGIDRLDKITGGLRAPCLGVVLGDTSTGKTAAMCELALESARHGVVVAYIDLETDRFAIQRKWVQQICGVDMFLARTDETRTKVERDADVGRASRALDQLRKLPLHIEDPNKMHFNELVSLIRQLHREKQPGLIVIDYFQKILRPQGSDVWGALTGMSAELQDLSRSLRTVIVFASQVTLTEYGSWQSRGAKDVEHDADVFLIVLKLLPEDEKSVEPRDRSRALKASPRALMSVSKARQGITGVVEVVWSDRWQRFFPYSEAQAYCKFPPDMAAMFEADEWRRLMSGATSRRDEPPQWTGYDNGNGGA